MLLLNKPTLLPAPLLQAPHSAQYKLAPNKSKYNSTLIQHLLQQLTIQHSSQTCPNPGPTAATTPILRVQTSALSAPPLPHSHIVPIFFSFLPPPLSYFALSIKIFPQVLLLQEHHPLLDLLLKSWGQLPTLIAASVNWSDTPPPTATVSLPPIQLPDFEFTMDSPTQPSRGRGRPRIHQSDQPPVAKEKKKRGRKPGSLGKKNLQIQRRSTRIEQMAPTSSPTALPMLLLLLLALALLVPGPVLRPDDDIKQEPGDKRRLTLKFERSESSFVEPEPAPPTAGYLGFPLEAMPPKPKRSSQSNRGKQLKAKNSLTPVSDGEAAAEAEVRYRENLETVKLDSLTEASFVRTPMRPTTPKKTPATPKRKLDKANSARKKRLKITSPKKAAVGLVPPAPAPESDASNNDDFCATCGGTGIFICCDTCPKLFHLLCCEPPVREIPEDNWNCNECRAAQGMDVRRLWNEIGMFGPLLNATHGRNPKEFRLPKRLRDATYVDVYTGDDQTYTDALVKPEVHYKNGQLVGFNKNEDLDVEVLYDKDGRPFLCHRCRTSGLNRRTLVACDYCSLRWHLDCLPEPMCLAKTLGLKWRCPNHVELLLPLNWLDRRSFRDTVVVDAALRANFLKIVQASNFLVKHRDQPYIGDTRNPLLQEYLQYQRADFLSNTGDFVEPAEKLDADNDNDEDTAAEFKVPDYLRSYAVDGKVAARSSRRLAKILLMTNADDPEQRPFVYRVPEQNVVLDFLASRKKKDILLDLRSYEDKRAAEHGQDTDAVRSLSALKREPMVKSLDFDELVAAAAMSNGVHADVATEIDVSGELDELRRIKTLMELKGRDSLLSFLES